MTVFATIAFAAFLLENDNFVAFEESGLLTFYLMSCNLADNFGTFNSGCANLNCAVCINEEHTVKLYGVTCFDSIAEIVNIQEAVLFCFELLTLNFYDYVHLYNNCIS